MENKRLAEIHGDLNRASFKVSIFALLLLPFIVYFCNRRIEDCNHIHQKVEQNLQYIVTHDDPIQRIVLKKAGNYKNLITADYIIDDPTVIQEIYLMLNMRKKGEWQRPVATWSTMLQLELKNGEHFEIEVARIGNSKKKVTHIYFMSGKCSDKYPSLSMELGPYLEQLTGFKPSL